MAKKKARFLVYGSRPQWNWCLIDPDGHARGYGPWFTSRAACVKDVAAIKSLIIQATLDDSPAVGYETPPKGWLRKAKDRA